MTEYCFGIRLLRNTTALRSFHAMYLRRTVVLSTLSEWHVLLLCAQRSWCMLALRSVYTSANIAEQHSRTFNLKLPADDTNNLGIGGGAAC